ncbi:MAG: FecR family protein [Prolixibacteraceae bacterium]
MKDKIHINPEFAGLLEKFITGECSLAELYRLEIFLDDEKSGTALKERMALELEDQLYPVNEKFRSERLFGELRKRISRHEKKQHVRRISFSFFRIAAMLVMSFILGGTLIYFADRFRTDEPESSWFEVVAPLGAKSQVILPDSSSIWLNAGSKLKYSSQFNKTERTLKLEGEAYFKVAKNKTLPFIVNAWGFLVEAVGTEFNIKAYQEEPVIETVLVEGKVELAHLNEDIADDTFLNPRYKATFYKSGFSSLNNRERLVITPDVDFWPLISWKDGRYIFNKELLKDLAVKLGRRYNYSFQFESDDVKNYRFSGTLKDETLEQVLDVIRFSSPISYEIHGNEVTIKKDLSRTDNFNDQ